MWRSSGVSQFWSCGLAVQKRHEKANPTSQSNNLYGLSALPARSATGIARWLYAPAPVSSAERSPALDISLLRQRIDQPRLAVGLVGRGVDGDAHRRQARPSFQAGRIRCCTRRMPGSQPNIPAKTAVLQPRFCGLSWWMPVPSNSEGKPPLPSPAAAASSSPFPEPAVAGPSK